MARGRELQVRATAARRPGQQASIMHTALAKRYGSVAVTGGSVPLGKIIYN